MPLTPTSKRLLFPFVAAAAFVSGFVADIAWSQGDSPEVPRSVHHVNADASAVYLPSVMQTTPSGEAPKLAVAQTAAQVHLPVLRGPLPDVDCKSRIVVQNVGGHPTKVALVQWAETDESQCPSCAGPIAVVCSGMVKPGSTWTFSADQVPDTARSAALFSFTTQTLSELGLDPGGDDRIVSDVMCEQLMERAIGSCAEFRSYREAFEHGTLWAGLPLDKVVGSPLAVVVVRACDDWSQTSYAGVPFVGAANVDPSATETLISGTVVSAQLTSVIHVQNTGLECATVEVFLRSIDSCSGQGNPCGSTSLPPGEKWSVPVAGCVASGFDGTALVRSSSPVAVVADYVDAGSTLSSSVEWRSSAAPVAAADSQGSGAANTVLFAPLRMSEYGGWDAAIEVANESPTMAAKVRVSFFDAGGSTVTTLVDWVCPRNSQKFFMPTVGDVLNGRVVGSVRVESVDWTQRVAAPIAGMVNLATRDFSQSASYPLLPASEAFLWPDGAGGRGVTSGVAVVAVPLVSTAADCPGADCGEQVDLAVMNLVPAEGSTDYLLMFYDSNGMVSSVCQRVGNQQVTYYDTARLRHLGPDFVGSAVISATAWQHPVNPFRPARNVVGLAAASIVRASEGADATIGDITLGRGLSGDGAREFAATVAAVPCPAQIAAAPPRVHARGSRLPVPLLTDPDSPDTCASTLALQNVGSNSVIAAVFTWGGQVECGHCTEPQGLWCSEPMGVGSALEFEPSVSAHSASVFTFDASAGSGLCSTISQAIAADCSLYSEFELAYASGGIFAGIDMSALAVGSLAGSVLRHCVPTDGETALALGYPLESAGRASPTTGAYAYRLPWLGSPENRTRLHVQSSGPSCVTVKVFAAPLGQCAPAGRPCLTLDVGAGQTVSADATSCVAGSETAGWIEASGPVGVVVDVDAAVLAARALWQTGAEGPVLSGSAAVDGPLLFSSLQGWTAEVRVVNLSDADALVAVSFDDREGTSLERQTAWVCANSVESIVLPATDHLPGDWMGVVRVASQAYHRGGALVQPSPLQAVMMLRRAPGAGAPAVATYPLVDSGPFASTGGAGPYNPASDAAVIALPGTGSAGGALRTRIAIANLVPVDGSTDFVMLFVDSNGLVDHVCSSLTESQVEYYDMASLSSLTPDFAGGVVISATTWNHERSLADGSTENRVGLGAVTVRELVGSGGDDSSETFPGLVLDTAPVAAPRCP